jgi:hypothetical protein
MAELTKNSKGDCPMATLIIPKKSSVADKVPLVGDLSIGEIAVNLTDKKFYSKNSSNEIVAIADLTTTGNVTDAGALMDSELTSIVDVKALDQSVVSGSTPNFAIDNMTIDNTSLNVVDTTNLQTFVEGADDALLKARGTGFTSTYVSTVAVGGTTFAQPAVNGEIYSDQGYFAISYAGATGITVATLTSPSTYVYIDNAGNLQQQTSIPTRQDFSRKMFTMRIAVDTVAQTILGFEYLGNPIGHYANSIRDLFQALIAQGVPFKGGQVITGRAGDLGFDVGAGTITEFGGTGNINNPNLISLDAVSNTTYDLLSRTAIATEDETNLVKFWDNAGSITPLGSGTFVAHRLYRFSNGQFAIQYGQGNYANIVLARAGLLIEDYILNERLRNATFFGWWIVGETATNTGGTTLTEFREYTIGVQGGSSSGLAGCLLRGNNFSDLLDVGVAQVNLGLEIGVDVQGYDVVLANTTASFLTAEKSKLNGIEAEATADQTAGEIESIVSHDNLVGFVADKHIAWGSTNAANIHADNYTDTTYSVGDGGLTEINFTTAKDDKLTGIEALADVTDTTNVVAALTAGSNVTISAGGVVAATDTDTTYVSSDFDHDALTGFVANEHIDWTTDQGATNINAGNYTDTDTTYSVGDGGLTQINFTTAKDTKLTGIEALADVTDATNVTAAGALMDDEVTNLTAVKSFDGADYATATQGSKADTALQPNDSPTFGNVTVTGTVDGRDIAQAIPASLGTAAQVLTVNAGATVAEWADAGGGGDFVAITEGSNTGYGTSYRADNPEDYGDIGSNAVDLSYSSSSSTTKGATGSRSTAMGNGTTASGSESTAMGNGTTASGYVSTAIGDSTTASSDRSTAMGQSTTASGTWSTAMGLGSIASGSRSVAMGHYTISNGIYATVTGRLGGIGSSSSTIFAVAYSGAMPTAGTADEGLVFKVNSAGNGYFDGVADSGNADYAEYFESFDGTLLERGHFVSFVEGSNCLEYGNANILGIVSSSPAVVGDSQSLHYKDKYKKDEFNTYIREPVVVTEKLHVLSAYQQGENWEVVTSGSLPDEMETFLVEIKNKETQEVLETLTDEAAIAGNRLYDFEVEVIGTYTHTMIDKVLSDTYVETREYLPRSERPEWSPIGLLGKLWVYLAAGEVAKVGDYITSDAGGKAVLCKRTDANAFRVLDVNTEYSLVKVFYK